MARTTPLVGIAAALLVALVGCAPAGDDVTGDASASPTSSPSATPEPSAEPTPSATEEPDGIDTSAWLEYASPEGDLMFRHPADWTLETTRSEPMPGAGPTGNRSLDAVEITAPNGQQLLTSYDFNDIGGYCPEVFPFEVLASEPSGATSDLSGLPSEIVTVAVGTPEERWVFGMGIASEDMVPQQGAETCTMYFTFGASDGGLSFGTHFQLVSDDDDALWSVDSIDDAYAYMETDEYATMLEILRSVRTA